MNSSSLELLGLTSLRTGAQPRLFMYFSNGDNVVQAFSADRFDLGDRHQSQNTVLFGHCGFPRHSRVAQEYENPRRNIEGDYEQEDAAWCQKHGKCTLIFIISKDDYKLTRH